MKPFVWAILAQPFVLFAYVLLVRTLEWMARRLPDSWAKKLLLHPIGDSWRQRLQAGTNERLTPRH